jgi:hypothetical protein
MIGRFWRVFVPNEPEDSEPEGDSRPISARAVWISKLVRESSVESVRGGSIIFKVKGLLFTLHWTVNRKGVRKRLVGVTIEGRVEDLSLKDLDFVGQVAKEHIEADSLTLDEIIAELRSLG